MRVLGSREQGGQPYRTRFSFFPYWIAMKATGASASSGAVVCARRLLVAALVGCMVPGARALLSAPPLQRLCFASSLAYCPGGVDEVSAKEYASMAQLVPLSRFVEPKTKSGVTVFKSTGVDDGDLLVVAFRGSANLENFATNLRFSLVPLEGHPTARVHKGFQEASQGLWGMLDEELKALQARGQKRTIFTGHSLGGATAQLCAMKAGKGRVQELVTFGGPLIGMPSCMHVVIFWPPRFLIWH